MAWSYRRSIKVGPFRISLNRRGISSVSAGNAVHRETVGRSGRTSTWRIPGTGISWRRTTRK